MGLHHVQLCLSWKADMLDGHEMFLKNRKVVVHASLSLSKDMFTGKISGVSSG